MTKGAFVHYHNSTTGRRKNDKMNNSHKPKGVALCPADYFRVLSIR